MIRTIEITDKRLIADAEVLQATFDRRVGSVKHLVSQCLVYNSDKSLEDRVNFVINIDGDCIITINGCISQLRTNTPAEDMNKSKSGNFYRNQISVYSNGESKYFRAFLNPELMDTDIFIIKKFLELEGKIKTLTLTCISIDEEDAGLIDAYYKIGKIEDEAEKRYIDPVFGNTIMHSGNAIIKTSEGG